MRENVSYKQLREIDLYDEILTNIVRYHFCYEFDTDSVNIFSRNRVTLSYHYPDLPEKFLRYLESRFCQ